MNTEQHRKFKIKKVQKSQNYIVSTPLPNLSFKQNMGKKPLLKIP